MREMPIVRTDLVGTKRTIVYCTLYVACKMNVCPTQCVQLNAITEATSMFKARFGASRALPQRVLIKMTDE